MSLLRWRKEARSGTETTSKIPLFPNDSLPRASYKSINGWLKQLQWRVSVSELLSDCGLSQVLVYSRSTSNLKRFAVVYSLHSTLKWKKSDCSKKKSGTLSQTAHYWMALCCHLLFLNQDELTDGRIENVLTSKKHCAHCITRWHLHRFCSCCVPLSLSLSLVPPPCCLFFTQASLCWTIFRPGISLSWLSAPHSRCFGSESSSSWRFSLSSGLSLSLCECVYFPAPTCVNGVPELCLLCDCVIFTGLQGGEESDPTCLAAPRSSLTSCWTPIPSSLALS